MVDVTRYEFTYEEIVTALIRHLDINEGIWALNTNFNFEVKNLRTDGNDPNLRPGFLGVLQHISLVRVPKGIPGLSADAAKVNPRPYEGQLRNNEPS